MVFLCQVCGYLASWIQTKLRTLLIALSVVLDAHTSGLATV